MEGYFPLKSKRKDLDLDYVNDDFSDFSLSSPARKIRRLDAELPPIIEEECEISGEFEKSPPQEQMLGSYSSGGMRIEELPSEPQNDERAIVLFQPMGNAPLLHQPSSFSVSLDPQLLTGFKNIVMGSSQSNFWGLADDKAEESNSSTSTGCLAVVPWVPSQLPSAPEAELAPQSDNYEMMDAQEVNESAMDVEDGTGMEQGNVVEAGGMNLSEGFHQWQQQQQQHCVIPQPPHNTPTPIVWYR